MDCLFCKIINKEIPSYTIYEDDIVKVFLDINPATNGDSLMVPIKHYENIFDIPEEVFLHMHKVSKKLYERYKNKLNIEGMTLVQNNGHGQEIKHYHLHLTPRYINDNLKHTFNKEILLNPSEIINKIKED